MTHVYDIDYMSYPVHVRFHYVVCTCFAESYVAEEPRDYVRVRPARVGNGRRRPSSGSLTSPVAVSQSSSEEEVHNEPSISASELQEAHLDW